MDDTGLSGGLKDLPDALGHAEVAIRAERTKALRRPRAGRTDHIVMRHGKRRRQGLLAILGRHHRDGLRLHGADAPARAAPDAQLSVDLGHDGIVLAPHHVQRMGGASRCASLALFSVEGLATLRVNHGQAQTRALFLSQGQRQKRTRGADLHATLTVELTLRDIRFQVNHSHSPRSLEDTGWAIGDTEATIRALGEEPLCGARAGRTDCIGTGLQTNRARSQAHSDAAGHQAAADECFAAARHAKARVASIGDGIHGARGGTSKAADATPIVKGRSLGVQTTRRADLHALAAFDAPLREAEAQRRHRGPAREQGADGAKAVAEEATAPEGQRGNRRQWQPSTRDNRPKDGVGVEEPQGYGPPTQERNRPDCHAESFAEHKQTRLRTVLSPEKEHPQRILQDTKRTGHGTIGSPQQ